MPWRTPKLRAAYARRWYAKNANRMRRYQKTYRDANPEKMKAQRRARYLKNREALLARCRKNYRKAYLEGKRYGRKYPTPTRLPPSSCECCGRKPARFLSLDHCHKSGRFRGWLCSQCNVGIGMLGDSLRGLKRAVKYLRENAR